MNDQFSRRRLLAMGLAVLAPASLAGCSGGTSSLKASSSKANCYTAAVAHGEGDAIQQAAVVPDGDDLLLHVALTTDAAEEGIVDKIAVSDGFDSGFVIPTNGKRVYEQHVGKRPLHGRYRLVALAASDQQSAAVGATGSQLDSLTIDFHCGDEQQA